MAIFKKAPVKPRPPAREPDKRDALVNNGFDFPMSGDGTADKDLLAPDLFLDVDLSEPIDGPIS